jgi:hypothetical protein
MYRRGMTSYIGAAWRLKRATMSISTMGAICLGPKFIVNPFVRAESSEKVSPGILIP